MNFSRCLAVLQRLIFAFPDTCTFLLLALVLAQHPYRLVVVFCWFFSAMGLCFPLWHPTNVTLFFQPHRLIVFSSLAWWLFSSYHLCLLWLLIQGIFSPPPCRSYILLLLSFLLLAILPWGPMQRFVYFASDASAQVECCFWLLATYMILMPLAPWKVFQLLDHTAQVAFCFFWHLQIYCFLLVALVPAWPCRG